MAIKLEDNDIKRLGVVGEKQWQHRMTGFCKPFTAATIRYFDHTAMNEAHGWLTGD